jgi:hypothetical protein
LDIDPACRGVSRERLFVTDNDCASRAPAIRGQRLEHDLRSDPGRIADGHRYSGVTHLGTTLNDN